MSPETASSVPLESSRGCRLSSGHGRFCHWLDDSFFQWELHVLHSSSSFIFSNVKHAQRNQTYV